MEKIGKRNGEIEFLRFVFSVIIVLHHSKYIVGSKNSIFLAGSFAVEFFFIVSGYLMMNTIDKAERNEEKKTEVGKETFNFIIGKIKSLYPEAIIAWIIGIFFISYVKRSSLFEILSLMADSFFEVIFLQMSGLGATTINGVVWYISSLILCMAILYPLIRRYKDMMIYVVLPLLIFFLLGYLCMQYDHPRSPNKWIGITYKGNIRAFAEISLGVVFWQVTKWLSNISFSKLGRILVTGFKWGLYIIIIYYMYRCEAGKRDFLFII